MGEFYSRILSLYPCATVTDAAGKPMEANPLRDARVRKAISKMIDRNAIASRIMEGEARCASGPNTCPQAVKLFLK